MPEIPNTVRRVIDRGVVELDPARVLLYGSRARGDHHPVSDFDLAFDGLGRPEGWAKYAFEMREDPPTLFGLDLVRLDQAPPELRANILEDGVVVYERP